MDLLRGVSVLDLTQLYPGESATLALADYGADVIKIERPGVGDIVRERTPSFKGDSRDHALRNRGKRSLSVDLKADAGRTLFLDLAREADVVVESFRPGVVDRLGIGYEAVTAVNDDIIYCSISGYGQEGPRSTDAGYDLNFLAMTGLLSHMGPTEEAPPTPPGFPIVDAGAGLTAVHAILAALFDRERHGSGHYLDVSMAEVAATWGQFFPESFFGEPAPSRGKQHYGNHPGNTVYETKDGEYISICAFDRTWASFCEAVDEPGIESPVDSADYGPIRERIGESIRTRSLEEWVELFDKHGVVAEPVADLRAVMTDPHFEHRAFTRTVTYPDGDEIPFYRLPLRVNGDAVAADDPAPRLGEDSIHVLAEIGYTDEEVRMLLDRGIIEARSWSDAPQN